MKKTIANKDLESELKMLVKNKKLYNDQGEVDYNELMLEIRKAQEKHGHKGKIEFHFKK